MANERIYSIKINGIESSIDIVDKLIKKLEDLEKRINNLQGAKVSVSASGGGGSSKSGGADLYDRIEKTQQKINQASDEEYKILLKKKAELKEIEKEQKAIVAGEKAESQEYANTLNGQRQKLADMKAALGNITIGSADFDKQVQEIDKLNSKILEIEKSYGQYGRNVGRYADGVAEGMTKITMTVNGTERTFNNARQALRQLTRERDAMGLNGQRTTEEFKQLDAAVKQLASDINDLNRSSAGMDKLLDTMQGFTAIGSIGTGLQNLFGFNNDKIGESIRKMMSLQSVMQGIEVIRKQMTTNEGLGAIFSGVNSSVDKFVTKLRVARAEMKGLAVDAKEVGAGTQAMANGLKTVLNVGAIAGLAYAIEKVYNTLTKTWDLMKKVFGYEDDLKEADRFEMQLKMIGDTAEDTNKQLDKLADQDKISNQEAFNKKMEASQKAIDEYLKLVKTANQLDGGFGKLKENLNIDDLIIPAEKAIDALSIAWDKWGKNVKATDMTLEENLAIWTQWIETGEDGGRNIAEVGRVLAGQYLTALQSCNLATKEGREEFQRLVMFIKSGALQGLFSNVEQIFNTSNNIVTKAMGKVYSQAWAAILKTSDTITDGVKEKTKKAVKKVGMTVQEQEQELTRLRIRAMDEGLQKVIAEINYNARKEIDALKLTGIRKAEAEELIEKERQRKIREAQAKNYQERIEARRNFNRQINQLEDENNQQRIENYEQDYQNFLEQRKNNIELQKELYGDDVALTPSYFKENPKFLEQLTTNLQLAEKERYEEILEARKKYYEDIFESETTWDEEIYRARLAHIQSLAELEKEEHEDELRKTWGDLNTVSNIMLLADEDISKAKELAKNKGGELGAAFASGKISIQEYKDTFDKFYADYLEKKRLLEEKTNNSLINLDIERVKEYSKAVKQEADSMMKDIEDIITGTERRYNSTKVTDVFGIVDLSASKKLTKETVAVYQDMQQRVKKMMDELTKKFEDGEISTEEYRDAIEKLTLIYQKLDDKTKETEEKQADFTDFLSSIMPYVSQLVNGLSNILSQVSNLVSAEFEAQRQKLDDELALLEEKYNEMEELEQRHADKISSIEDEIANARGARRDHLVDMYNEEIAAQRRAFIEKQKIDAEMKRNEEKQRALEKAERKKQNQIQFQQALMSQSLAILNAFATKPWQVGLVMGAMATVLTGVQIALMKKSMAASEKYADGGVIQGKSHAQGGIKVLGGKAEVEGGEYITNKRTTALNQPVLEYINSKHRTLTAADFLEFYNGKGNKTIKNNFKTKYASGGILPSVSATKANNIIIVKDESQPVVSVVDIINAEDNYNNVRVLAGVD